MTTQRTPCRSPRVSGSRVTGPRADWQHTDGAAPTAQARTPHVAHSSLLELQRLVGNVAVSRIAGVSRLAEPGQGSLHQMVSTALGGPSPSSLPASVRTRMEPVLDQDLSGVRVRTDRASTEALGARAYTVGDDIVVHPGEGGGASADHVLAHEAVHVAQQRSGPVSGTAVGGVAVSDPGDPFEREAERLSHGSASPEGAFSHDHGATGATGAAGPALQRFPATVLTGPAPWRQLTGGVDRPGDGLSGGIYILTSGERAPEVETVVVKPIFGANAAGVKESGASMTFGDRAIAQLFGIRTPASRTVPKGSAEFAQLLAVCEPHAPPRPEGETEAELWQPLSGAKSFIVMAEVPDGSSLKSMAEKGATDTGANERLHATVFDPGFLRQLGRLCIADLLIGNNDRMIAGAMNLGNVMVSSRGQGPEVWAIDSNAVLGEFDPNDVLKSGTTSTPLQGFTSTKVTLKDGPATRLDGFFTRLAHWMKAANPPGGDDQGLQLDPAEVLTRTYEAKRETALVAFEAGWTSGLETVRELVESKSGRKQMKDLTEEVGGQEGSENVSYTALKTNALYLGARARGAGHDEVKQGPATYAALKLLAEFDPASVKVPEDGHSWQVARVPSADVLGARLERIDALPAPRMLTKVVRAGGKHDGYDTAVFSDTIEAAGHAREEVQQLGTKKRGLFSKSTQPRNRVMAGRFVSETYELAAAAMRSAGAVKPMGNLANRLDVAISGKATRNQAGRALPAAQFLQGYLPTLRRDLVEYTDNLRAASKGVAKMRHYVAHPALADVLARIANYVEQGEEKLSKGKLENANLYTNALKSISSRP